MNAKTLADKYDRLTPEETFRLILAAAGRNDEVERERLIQARPPISLKIPDHMPHAIAFGELALYYFIELQDHAASYFDLLVRADLFEESVLAPPNFGGVETDDENLHDEADHRVNSRESSESDDEESDDDCPDWDPDAESPARSAGERCFRAALAEGYVLKAKADAWKLFCKRLDIPPFVLWQGLPGLKRLMVALDLAEKAAFSKEGIVRWLNEVRPAGEPRLTSPPFEVDETADSIAEAFRDRVRWWGG